MRVLLILLAILAHHGTGRIMFLLHVDCHFNPVNRWWVMLQSTHQSKAGQYTIYLSMNSCLLQRVLFEEMLLFL